jgi:hypothetical protein
MARALQWLSNVHARATPKPGYSAAGIKPCAATGHALRGPCHHISSGGATPTLYGVPVPATHVPAARPPTSLARLGLLCNPAFHASHSGATPVGRKQGPTMEGPDTSIAAHP